MLNEDIIEKLRIFFQKFVGHRHIGAFEEIFTSRLVNSLVAMQLILFIEKEFLIVVKDDDLDLKNFNSLDATANFILSKNN